MPSISRSASALLIALLAAATGAAAQDRILTINDVSPELGRLRFYNETLQRTESGY